MFALDMFDCRKSRYYRLAVYVVAFGLRKKKDKQRKFIAYFKKRSQSKDEIDGIQITNVLTSVTENATSAKICWSWRGDAKLILTPEKISSQNSCKD